MKIDGIEYSSKHLKLLVEEHKLFQDALHKIKFSSDLEDAKGIAFVAINNDIWE